MQRISRISGTILGVIPLIAISVAAYGAAADSAPGSINKPALMQGAGEPQAGVWVPKKASFGFQGFTTRYTCDAMEDAIRDVLRQFGARRADMKLSSTGCADPNKPSPIAGVEIRMNVLQPAPGAGGESVAAHWKTVDLKFDRKSRNEGGQCELVEAIRKQIVPLFTTRNLESRTTCIPHEITAAEPTLKVDVLYPDVEPPKT